MGFGFNLLFIFIFIPLTILLTLALTVTWLFTKEKLYGKLLGMMWGIIFGLFVVLGTTKWLTNKTVLKKEDYYGHYIVNRDYFTGRQTDWQYDHFRFEIKENDSIYFYQTDKEKILNTYKGTITTTSRSQYNSARLKINMEQPTIHILASNPTTHREAWGFYLTFYSPKFNNLFFKKGKWKPIDN